MELIIAASAVGILALVAIAVFAFAVDDQPRRRRHHFRRAR